MDILKGKITKKTLTIIIEVSVLFCLFILLLLYGFNKVMNAIVHIRKEVMVPNIFGKTIEESLDILGKENLYLQKEGEQYSDKMPPGYIVFQNPLAGTTIKEKRIVKVIISQGGEVVFVPDLINQNMRSAEVILRKNGLSLGEEARAYSLKIAKELVISQDPMPLSTVGKNSLVNLVVSDGPPQEGVVLMPDLIGKDIKQAIEIIKQWDLNVVRIDKKEDATLPLDTVTGQDPLPDTLIDNSNNQIILTISASRENLLYSDKSETKFIYYEVSQGMFDKQIRIIVVDKTGERTVYDKTHSPGTKINIPIEVIGQAKVKIYVNDILMVERGL